jgi:putative transcriptional regulator
MDQEIEKGKLLIAMPMLVDPNFRQAIVLLCEHGPEGSLGLVVNRPTNVEVSTLVQDFPDLANTGRVFSGGPVGRNTLLVLCHGNNVSEEHRILKNIFLAKDLEMLRLEGQLEPELRIRCYIGYAGWGPGQLEAEVTAGAWHLMPANPDLIFNANSTTLWQGMMAELGGEWTLYATMPPDPSVN